MSRSKQTIFFIIVIAMMSMTSSAQTWQWANRAGGDQNDFANGVAVDASGNSYVTGTFRDSISFGTTHLVNHGAMSVFISKYDVTGTLIWAKIAATDSVIYVAGIDVSRSGSISITGQFSDTMTAGVANPVLLISGGDNDVFISNYDNNGDILWAKSLGGPGIDYPGGISSDHDGNVYLTGDFHLSSFPFSGSKIFLAKYDSLGNNSWLRMETSFDNNHFGNGIKTDANGNSYVTGEFFDTVRFGPSSTIGAGNVESNAFIAKFDSSGAMVWGQKAGSPSGYCGSKAIDIDDAGNSYFTGYYKGTISLGPINIVSASGNTYDVFVTKCDPFGNYEWANKSNGPGNARYINVDDFGDVFVSGTYSTTISFGPNVLISLGSTDIFIAETDPFGNFSGATSCGGTQADYVSGMDASAAGLFLTGYFTDTIHFGNSISTVANSSTATDVFLAKMGIATIISEPANAGNDLTCFPNPSAMEIEIRGGNENGDYSIYDDFGKIVRSGALIAKNKFFIGDLPKGIYLLQLISQGIAGKRSWIKFVRE